MGQAPDYETLTNTGRKKLPDDQKFPAIFDRNVGPDGRTKPGNLRTAQRGVDAGRPKKVRLRDQLQTAWAMPGDKDAALKMAAYAVGCDVADVPEEARETLATLTAWVFAMRAVGGSVEHFREIGDRIDPKPKRIEIEGVNGARRGGVSNNPDEAAEADSYYRAISGEIIDAEVVPDDDLSFLD